MKVTIVIAFPSLVTFTNTEKNHWRSGHGHLHHVNLRIYVAGCNAQKCQQKNAISSAVLALMISVQEYCNFVQNATGVIVHKRRFIVILHDNVNMISLQTKIYSLKQNAKVIMNNWNIKPCSHLVIPRNMNPQWVWTAVVLVLVLLLQIRVIYADFILLINVVVHMPSIISYSIYKSILYIWSCCLLDISTA